MSISLSALRFRYSSFAESHKAHVGIRQRNGTVACLIRIFLSVFRFYARARPEGLHPSYSRRNDGNSRTHAQSWRRTVSFPLTGPSRSGPPRHAPQGVGNESQAGTLGLHRKAARRTGPPS
jgi:hypothetical protein